MTTDGAGFERRWGVQAFWCRGAPWFSLGVHLDWHTPTLDVHFARGSAQVGRNNWRRTFDFVTDTSDGHTMQCVHPIEGEVE